MVIILGCDCGPKIDFYPETEHTHELPITRDYPCGDVGKVCAVGQCFKTPPIQRYNPCEVTFYLRKKGQPSGWMWCKLYDVTGSCGVDCKPDDDKFLCGTGGMMVSSLTTSFQLITFNFSSCVCLEPDHCYAVVFVAWSGFGGLDDNNFIEVGIDKDTPTHQGNTVYYKEGAWHSYGPDDAFNIDTIFYICGTDCTPPVPAGSDVPATTEQAKIIGPRKTILYNLEHMVLHIRSPLGKNITFPCWIRGFVGRLSQPIVVVVKAGLGVPAFFETVVRAGIKRGYEETLHLQSKLGIKYAETFTVKEDVRGYLLTQKAVMKNFQESLINFMESLSKKQYETEKDVEEHKKKQKMKDRLRELINHVKEVD